MNVCFLFVWTFCFAQPMHASALRSTCTLAAMTPASHFEWCQFDLCQVYRLELECAGPSARPSRHVAEWVRRRLPQERKRLWVRVPPRVIFRDRSLARKNYNQKRVHLAVWSHGMILASGARGPGSNSRRSPRAFAIAASQHQCCKARRTSDPDTRGDTPSARQADA